MTGHIRQRSPGSWELRYSLGGDPATGRRKTVTATVRGSRKDAEKELRRLLRSVDTGEHVDPTKITVGRFLTIWLDTVKNEVAPRSHERYSSIVLQHLIPALGNLHLVKLTPTHIQSFYNALSVGGRADGKFGPLAPRSRRQIHRVLSEALCRAVEQQVIARNPCDVFKRRLPKVERKEMSVLSGPQSQVLLDAVRGDALYTPILLALSCGLRRGEALALRWRNIDFERRTVLIAESLEQITGSRASLRFKPPKSDRTRRIILPTFAVEELRRLKREQAEMLLKLGIRQNGDTLACARSDGEPTTPVALTHSFTRLIKSMPDMPRVRYHDLRHSHATQLLLAGVHPKVAQERLGHSTITLTLDLYSHVTETMQEDAAAKIDAAFRGQTQ